MNTIGSRSWRPTMNKRYRTRLTSCPVLLEYREPGSGGRGDTYTFGEIPSLDAACGSLGSLVEVGRCLRLSGELRGRRGCGVVGTSEQPDDGDRRSIRQLFEFDRK